MIPRPPGLTDAEWLAYAAREGGRKGGQARVQKGFAVLSRKERREVGRQAARARWAAQKKREGV